MIMWEICNFLDFIIEKFSYMQQINKDIQLAAFKQTITILQHHCEER